MKKFKELPWEKTLTNLVIVYFGISLVFAIFFAAYYRWEWYGFFSPNFLKVAVTWPYEAIGFIKDLLYFGLAGKPTPI